MRTRQLTGLILLVAVCATCTPMSAASFPEASPIVQPPGTPDLSQMVLAPSDFAPEPRITEQRYDLTFAGLGVISYKRRLASATTAGARFTEISSEVALTPSLEVATETLVLFKALLRSPRSQRQTRARTIRAYGGRTRVRPRDIRFGPLRRLHVGEESMLLPWSVRVGGVLHHNDAIRLRIDRVVGSLELTGVPRGRTSLAEVQGLARVMAERMSTGLSPLSSVPPAITGTAAQGQPLSATNGTWSNGPTSFAYQWERCDAIGANCALIPGANGHSYTPTAADLTATIRISVTATNTVGSSSAATSSPTVVIQ